MSKLLAALSIVLAVAATVLPASAQDKGPIVLTIAGAIETANRGGVDPFDDVYLDLLALDGYAVELPLAELAKFPVVLALKNDGEWLGLGGRGPTWVVYPQDDFAELAERDANWVFSVFYIDVD